MDKYLVCNADESEPGTFKDRELMQKNPHLLIEGVHHRRLRGRGQQRVHLHPRRVRLRRRHPRRRRWPRPRPAGHVPATLNLWVHRGAGAYICGEETALLDSLEGKRGNPRLKPPFPAVQGLYQGPTLINNVETLMNAADHPADGRRGVREDRHGEVDRHEGRLASAAASSARATTRSCSAPDARDHLRPRRRAARGPLDQVLLPRRVVVAGAPGHGRDARPALRLRLACRRPARCSARARSSSSTTRSRSSTSR